MDLFIHLFEHQLWNKLANENKLQTYQCKPVLRFPFEDCRGQISTDSGGQSCSKRRILVGVGVSREVAAQKQRRRSLINDTKPKKFTVLVQ